jgi:ribonuclease P protein component
VVYGCRRKDTEQFRVGVSCSKKIGNAVVRNRMRRMIKEIVRHHEHEIVTQMDLIFIVRKGALDMPYKEMEKSLLHAMRKGSLLKSSKR